MLVDPLETIVKGTKPDAVLVDPLEAIVKEPKPEVAPVDPLEAIVKGPKVPVGADSSGGVFLEVGWGGSAVQLGKDFYKASTLAAGYFPAAIGEYIPDIEDVRQGLVLLMGGATVIVGGSAGIGALIGGLTTGGAGIATGAALGAQVGAEILKYLGFGFLVIQLGQAVVELGRFFDMVVQAKGDHAKVDAAARQLAKALALVLMLAVEALVGYAAQKTVPVALEKLRGSKLLEVLDLQVARAWLLRKVKAHNLLKLAKGDKAGLKKAIAFYKDAQEVERLLRSGRTLAQLNGLADSSTAFQHLMGKNYAPLMKDAAALLSDPALEASLSALTQEEIAAIIGYTGMDYSLLNSALRSNTAKRVQKLAPYIDRIKGGLSQLPDHVGVVYRGASPPADVVAKYVVGNVVEEAAFTSTSLAKGSAFQGKIQYTIVSKTGKKINFLSMFGNEGEVLFAPGARFKILEVTPVGRTTHVKMSQL